jgi:hypothetical protein
MMNITTTIMSAKIELRPKWRAPAEPAEAAQSRADALGERIELRHDRSPARTAAPIPCNRQ